MSDEKPYHVDDDADCCDEYSVLVGPDDFECFLGEAEDCTWRRDGQTAVDRLNEQHAELAELRQAVAKMSHRQCRDCGNIAYHQDAITPYVLCEKCGSQDTRLIRE